MTPKDEALNRKLREKLRGSFQNFRSTAEAKAAFIWSRSAMTDAARHFWPCAEVLSLGPDALGNDLFDPARVGVVTGLGDDRWSALIKVDTDEMRDQLKNDNSFRQTVLAAASEAGFPPYDIGIESQETVDRDFRGSWSLRWKA